MVSLLPLEVKQKHIKQWTRARNMGIAILVFSFVGFVMVISMLSAAGVGLPPIITKYFNTQQWAKNTVDTLRSVPREEKKEECDPHQFKTRRDACDHILKNNDCGSNIFQYIRFCFCWHWVTWPLWYIPMALYVLICFYTLGSTAGDYFSPALVKLSDYLRLPPNIAGVTLLALGNGAPDLSAIIVSTLKGETDVGFSGPVGGGMFVSCFVFGCVCIFAHVKVARRPFLRDIGFYFISVIFVTVLYFVQYVPIFCSLGFFVIYGVYVLTVMIGRFIHQKAKKIRNKRKERKEALKKKTELGEELLSPEEMLKKAAEESDHDSEGEDSNSDDEFDWTASYKNKSFMQKLRERNLKKKGGAFLPKMGLIMPKEEQSNSTVVVEDYFSEDKGVDPDAPKKKKKKAEKTTPGEMDEEEDLLANEERIGEYAPPVLAEEAPQTAQTPQNQEENPEKPPEMEKATRNESDSESDSDSDSDGEKKPKKSINYSLEKEKEVATPGIVDAAAGNIKFIENVKEKRVKHQTDDDDDSSSSSSSSESENGEDGEEGGKPERDVPKSVVIAQKITSFADWVKEKLDWEEMGFMDKITFLLGQWILVLLRNMTIYQVEEGKWSKPWTVIVTLCFPTLILTAISNLIFSEPFKLWLYQVTEWNVEIFKYPVTIPIFIPYVAVSLAIGVVPAMFVFFTTKSNRPPIYEPIFVCCAFVLAIIWIYLTADTLVSILKALGVALNIPKSILALTLLAWGNSIGDLFGDISVAREGYPSMAVGACFGGPLMNVLLGLGIGLSLSMIINFFKSLPFIAVNPLIPFMTLFFPVDLDPCVTVGSLFLITGLIFSMCCVPMCCFRGDKCFGLFMLLFYCVFLVSCITAGLLNPALGKIFEVSIKQNIINIAKFFRVCPEFICGKY